MKSFEAQITPEIFNYEQARKKEENFLGKFIKNPKTRTMAAAFLLVTAACGNIESGDKKYKQSTDNTGPGTRIETREFKGYGIHTKQRVEVDKNGNVVRVLPPSEFPYRGN
jgi:hypothetical protein